MIGHGHIDPVWLWPWSEGVSVVHSTFRSALDRMKETPDVVFASSSAQFYQWVADNDPAMLEEIKQQIKAGNWNVVGGWWVEPDVNCPSGEALVRQGLYGQLTLEKLLGQRAKIAFNPDSFGHPGTLPQILRQQGMENYVFMRPDLREKTIPSDLFWWEAPDGSRVLTYRIQDSYNMGRDAERRFDLLLKLAPSQPMTDFMVFYGVGDHGGGPTKETIQTILTLKAEKDAPVIQFSTIDRYFDNVRAKSLNLPTVKDDLQHHAVGCYTADAELKKNNRLSEYALVTAEKIAAIGSVFWGVQYPKEEFTKAWKQVLLMQFHDSLAGTSVMAHSQDAREGHHYALSVAHTATIMAAQKLEWQIAAEDPDSEYIVVLNPHAWEVKTNVEYDISNKPNPQVTNERGQVLPSQYVQAHSVTGRRRILFNTTLPAFGYRQIRISRGADVPVSQVSAQNNQLENEYYRITFSPDGQVGIFDKEAGRDVFKGGNTGCKGVIIDDPSDTWSHEVRDFTKNTSGSYNYTTQGEIGAFGRAKIKTLENGPLRAALRVQTFYGQSDMTIDWRLTAGSRHIEALATLNWHEQLKMLKFSFPVDVESPVATYETPYGFIVRDTNGEEEAGQRWIDVTGRRGSGSYGLTVFNNAKYGYSILDSDMRVTVTRSAPYAHHGPGKLSTMDPDGNCYWQDQGIQTFRLLLAPHPNNWQDINAPRIADEFIAPPVTVYQGIHRGSKPKSGSFLSVEPANVIVSALKMSESGNYGIIRLVETSGKDTSLTLRFPSFDYQWNGKIRAFEIKTLRIDVASGGIREVNLLEE
jgi:alpha-mannosidase